MSGVSTRLRLPALFPITPEVSRPAGESPQRVLKYLDLIFGAYCLAVASVAGLAWLNGRGTVRTVVTLVAFVAVNAAISQISNRIARPGAAEIGRVIAGAVVAPLAYLATDAPFGMWWLGFLIMALGAVVFFGLLTGSPVLGRVASVYYALALFVTELMANPHPNWYAFSGSAGAIIMVGFLFAEIVALLDRALVAERDQTEALKREKARSEQLLQKEAEAALRASEAHFRTLIEHSSDGISIVDREGRMLYMSPAAERILGRSQASVVGQVFTPFVHPDDRDRTLAEFARQLAAPHETHLVDTRVVRPDGAVRALEVVGRVLPSGDVVGNLRDVTERREMDRAFRAIVEGTAGMIGRDFFRSLVEHLATALDVDHAFVAEVVSTEPRRVGTLAFWSRGQIIPNFGYPLRGTPCEGVVAGDLCFCPAGVQQAFPGDRDLVALGAESYLGMPLRDSQGQVIGHVAVLDNQTMGEEPHRREILSVFAARAGAEIERQRAEEALQELNNQLERRIRERTEELEAALTDSSRLSAVLEATTDVVGVAALDGQMLFLNRAGRERLRMPADADITTYTMPMFYTPESFEVVATVGMPAAMRTGHWSGELVMRSLQGDEIPISMSGHVHVDAGGNPMYISGIARDISESKRIAAELKSAKENAEAASQAKSTFLATMSHEIRTPMNAVIGMTDLLLTTALTPKQRDFVETLRAGGDALLTVINDVLDFSKIEAGKLDLERRAFDVRRALESAVDLLAPRAAEKGLELALSVDPAVPEAIVGDETRLRQILVNLAGNAIKFTERGEVVVSVTAAPRQTGDSQIDLLFGVRDTGIGLPPAKRDRLFAPFSQLDPSTTREYGGTGLGLAISRRLVELMGGTIWVESDGLPGHGSVFQFTIRAGRVAVDDRLKGYDAQPALAGRRVLVVDDNATNRQILGLQLQAWGMFAVEAALPSEALDSLRRRERFDLVILDMQMPDMDGVSLAKAICAHRGGRRLPIIMLTSLGHSLSGDAEAIECFSSQLTKPVKSSQLYDAIVVAMAGRGVQLETPAARVPAATEADATVTVSLQILLAEDMEVNRRFALVALDELGFSADVAINGREALQMLTRKRYDVVLMDVQMPEIDGLEATRQIRRELPLERQPHIIAMTANAMEGDRDMCLRAGMDDYLSKPVYLDELRAALVRVVERIGTWRTAAPAGPRTASESDSPRRAAIEGKATDHQCVRGADQQLAQLFLTEGDAVLDQLRVAFESGDIKGVRDAAHKLKGSSAYLGADRFTALSARIERLARSGQFIDGADLSALEEEFNRVRDALLSMLGKS